jgi:hypothetical protein
MVIVTGDAPHRNPITPPRATACTTAEEVQLAAVPVPTYRVGLVVTGPAAAGTAARPAGLPTCPRAEPDDAPAPGPFVDGVADRPAAGEPFTEAVGPPDAVTPEVVGRPEAVAAADAEA